MINDISAYMCTFPICMGSSVLLSSSAGCLAHIRSFFANNSYFITQLKFKLWLFNQNEKYLIFDENKKEQKSSHEPWDCCNTYRYFNAGNLKRYESSTVVRGLRLRILKNAMEWKLSAFSVTTMKVYVCFFFWYGAWRLKVIVFCLCL